MELFLRVFVKCGDAECATHLQQELCKVLAAWASAEPSPAKRYWKMPELFEITFCLAPANHTVLSEIIASVKYGWHHSGDELDRSSVWNKSPGLSFLAPEVTWAELQLYAPAP